VGLLEKARTDKKVGKKIKKGKRKHFEKRGKKGIGCIGP